MPLKKVEELCLECGAGPVGVEIREERILRVLEYERRVKPGCEPLCERGLACTNRSFDRDVAELQGATMISSRRDAYDDRARARARRVRMCQRSSRTTAT